ncbi:MAG: hypothetical protein Satyrvirus23_14 [Satyrvirus sp.]|uniref:HNH endonuclease n=1 Tax=Satyrvirus sp. TaxID=2487771 RepID=A0A3G5AGZ3_9VIRU|nr:MAG: hypothetical protein Satyrvirus23_14 [Satyrvirus sp.]
MKEKYIVYHKKNFDGSQMIQFSNLGERKDFLVHRLVGSYFLKKKNSEDNLIYHKDKNKSNNNVENLGWCHKPGIDILESHYNVPYYDPETAVKPPKRKSVKDEPKDLLTAKRSNLSKYQRELRKKLLEERDKKSGSKTSKKKKSNSKQSSR